MGVFECHLESEVGVSGMCCVLTGLVCGVGVFLVVLMYAVCCADFLLCVVFAQVELILY